MFQIGQIVRVTEPFTGNFPDTYEITEIVVNSPEELVYILGDHGGFDQQFLEAL